MIRTEFPMNNNIIAYKMTTYARLNGIFCFENAYVDSQFHSDRVRILG